MFDIRARQPSLFPIALANDNVHPKRRATGALDFERLREVFHGCGLKGSAAVALLADQRDALAEIRIDGMRLHRCPFHIAVIAGPLYPSACAGRALRSSPGGCFRRSSMHLSVAQRTTLSQEGLQRR